VYASLLCVLANMFCKAGEISSPSADADAGKGAADTTVNATGSATASRVEIMVDDDSDGAELVNLKTRGTCNGWEEDEMLETWDSPSFYAVVCLSVRCLMRLH
jgi:hypothetical protein